MKLIVKYWNSIYIYVLLMITGACFCAGLFFTFFKLLGNYPELLWIQIILFDFSHIIYIGIAIFFIIKNKKDCTYIPTHLCYLKSYAIIILVIQYIFILALFPSTYIWTLTYLFIVAFIFFFDSRITGSIIILLTLCLVFFIWQNPAGFLPLEKENYKEIIAFQSIEYIFMCVFLMVISVFVEKLLFKEHFDEEENLYLLERQLEYYHHTDLMDKELRKFRHDIKNHFLSMQELLKHQEYEKLTLYFEDLKQSFSFQERMYFSGNLIIDAIMNYDLTNRCSSKVQIHVTGSLTEITSVSSMDLCTLFSNLLSNAVSAANKYAEQDSASLCVHFQSGSKYFSITIANHTIMDHVPDISPRFGTFTNTSTAQNGNILSGFHPYEDRNHGYGIAKIRDVVQKYHGTMEHSIKQHVMTIKVYLPL